MERILELLSQSGVLPSKDLPTLRIDLAAKPRESPAEHSQRIVRLLQDRYSLTAEQVAEYLVKSQLEAGHALRVLKPVIRVLLVEDNPADVELTRRALLRQQRFEFVGIAHDGKEALSFIRREHPFENAKRPDMILLDLDLPRMDGFDVLREIKDDPAVDTIPVVVLSGTTRRNATQEAFRTRAVSFIRKPNSLSDYRRVANQLEVYWSQVSSLP